MNNVNMPGYQRTRTNDQTIPGSWSEEDVQTQPEPETHYVKDEREREKQKARSIGKLFKRKPVQGKDELRVMNP
jgi:hypothetical protein